MKMDLLDLGLTEGEVAVYLGLLELGPSTNSPLARHTGLQSSSVYYCLNRLIEKGFVSYIVRRSRKLFMATDPASLLLAVEKEEELLAEKKARLEKLLPQLQQLHRQHAERTTAEVFEGIQGMRRIFNEIYEALAPGEEYVAFVVEEALGDREELSIFFKQHNMKIKRKGVGLRLLAPERYRTTYDALYGKEFLAKYQSIRYTKESIPIGTTICKDMVVTHVEEQGKIIAFRIRNTKYAQIQREHFESVWARAKE